MWAQASLPINSGNMGVLSATQLTPAFLALAGGCTKITQELLPFGLRKAPYQAQEDALRAWREGIDDHIPPPVDDLRQKAWDTPQVTASFQALLNSAPDTPTRARLLAASMKEAGAWLQALPVSAIGLRINDDVMRIAMGLCLGLPLCQLHRCHLCWTPVDHQGTHGLYCRKSLGRHPRHSAINDIIKRSTKILAHL